MEFLDDRPYPPTGMTSARWLEVEPKLVEIEDLCFTQRGVWLEALLDPKIPYGQAEVGMGGDEYCHVVCWKGRLYLEDGHTRMARRLLRGKRWAVARILCLEGRDRGKHPSDGPLLRESGPLPRGEPAPTLKRDRHSDV